MNPFYIFVAAVLVFLVYNYRQVIKERLGYHDSEIFTQSVKNLQDELRGTADAIIEQFAREHQRMETKLAEAAARITELENLLQAVDFVRGQADEQVLLPDGQDKFLPTQTAGSLRCGDQRVRIVGQMATYGMDVYEISQATGLDYSEVRLLMNIMNRESRTANPEP